MLCKVLILLVLCAAAGAFPSLRSELTSDLLELIPGLELTTYGEVPGDQEQTTYPVQTTYPESTSDMNLDVMNISKFYVDLETATAIYYAEEASEAPDDYNTFQTMSFVGEDFDQNSTFPENNEYTSVYL
uniref:kidney androgen-regulated protein-like n=1 Tax=Ictidomys tridecemlineatus TaxID=43179 RepID=UPI000B543E49|nr:kidney androgen-regulated protein-like [Ictidomys tridecemlineatus]